MTRGKIFFFDDKAIHDAVYSSRRPLSDLFLREYAAERGVFFAWTATREEICDYFATWFNDYNALDIIQQKLMLQQKRTKNEQIEFSSEKQISPEAVSAALKSVKETFAADESAALSINTHGDKSFSANFRYSELDYSKTPLKQVSSRSAEISVEIANGKVVLRLPAVDGVTAFKTEFQKALAACTKEVISLSDIRLKDGATTEDRLNFFFEILMHIPEMEQKTVVSVQLSSDAVEQDEEGEELETDEQATNDFEGLLRAKLEGGKLLDTDEFKSLRDKGFYPNEVRWLAQEHICRCLVEYSVGFSNGIEGKGFRYDACSIRYWRDSKHGSKQSLRGEERDRYLRLLETRVREVCNLHLYTAGGPL